MLNDLMEKRKKILAESEEHKNHRNELNAAASKSARERNTLNNQTREFVEEAQKNKDLRDKYNQEVLDIKAQRNDLNDKANVLFEDIESFKKEHGSLKNRGIKELQKQIEYMEYRQQTEVFTTDKERELIEKIKQMKGQVREQEAELEQNKEMRTKVAEARDFRKAGIRSPCKGDRGSRTRPETPRPDGGVLPQGRQVPRSGRCGPQEFCRIPGSSRLRAQILHCLPERTPRLR